ncbi:hypothetical protein [Haliangium sp.]|uniref:hypothetical protein n=1 Tax=Haliangium sp. TaxID=2663208 RepID=UPI003D113268
MLRDELHDLLRELALTLGASRVGIEHRASPPANTLPRAGTEAGPAAPTLRYEPLGNKAYLCIEHAPPALVALEDDADDADDAGAPGLSALEPYPAGADPGLGDDPDADDAAATPADEQALAIERTIRALRAAGRRWQSERLPELSVTPGDAPMLDRTRVIARIEAFLTALANMQNTRTVAVTLAGQIIAASAPPEELEQERLPFLLRRLAVEAERNPASSHAEIADPDVFLSSFWFDACLVAFFTGPYAVDFFRHRANMVTRELAQLLPMLDDPPPGAAGVAPIPE